MASNSGNLLKRRCAPGKKPVTTARALDLGLTRFWTLCGGGVASTSTGRWGAENSERGNLHRQRKVLLLLCNFVPY